MKSVTCFALTMSIAGAGCGSPASDQKSIKPDECQRDLSGYQDGTEIPRKPFASSGIETPSRGLYFGVTDAPGLKSTGWTWWIEADAPLDLELSFTFAPDYKVDKHPRLLLIVDGVQQPFVTTDGQSRTTLPIAIGALPKSFASHFGAIVSSIG